MIHEGFMAGDQNDRNRRPLILLSNAAKRHILDVVRRKNPAYCQGCMAHGLQAGRLNASKDVTLKAQGGSDNAHGQVTFSGLASNFRGFPGRESLTTNILKGAV